MAKDYAGTAREVLKLVGGEENITHLEHCSTRLRFSIADGGKVEKDKLKAVSGVMGVIASGNQCQVVIGNDVIEVYDELMKMGKFTGGNAAPASGEKKEIGAAILDFMVGVFQPLVPAIAGAGILKAMLSLFTMMGIMSSGSAWYTVLYNAADAALYFLPVLVAVTMSTKLNCNRLVAVSAVGAMILPGMTAAIGEGLTLAGFTVQNIAYTYQVFPAILTVALLYYVEKWVTKISPKPIRVFFVPMICFIVVVPLALLVLGPLGYNVGQLLTTAILFLYDKLGWLAVGLLAAILPFMISMGMHKALVPYAVTSVAEMGEELLYMPASLAHNISEGGACFAVALKTKDTELRSAAVSAGISAIFGITEPALYGVTIQHKRALYGVVIGSFVGGITVGLAGLKAFVAMGPGLAGMAMFVDVNNGMNIVWGFVGFGVALAVSFIATFILFKDAEAEESQAPKTAAGENAVCSPLDGKLIDITEVKDEVFSAGILGDGMAVIPEKGELYAPVDATVDTVFDSKHAISLIGDNGAEILLHVGLDTVKLEGMHFEPQVKNGDRVKAGQLLMKFDIKEIKKAGYDIVTPIIITNSDKYKLSKATGGLVSVGNPVIGLEKKEDDR
ncbi:PTS system beta-glucoside-specific EIIBCA component [Lachnospiraceae bacterium]|nr:PTS system beta-glucoside-specific EIIBCA component [Lachnospiraceae bacterium]